MTPIGALIAKLFLAMLAFPPIFILAKYLRWCDRQDRVETERQDEEA